jgi:hypothetical protein
MNADEWDSSNDVAKMFYLVRQPKQTRVSRWFSSLFQLSNSLPEHTLRQLYCEFFRTRISDHSPENVPLIHVQLCLLETHKALSSSFRDWYRSSLHAYSRWLSGTRETFSRMEDLPSDIRHDLARHEALFESDRSLEEILVVLLEKQHNNPALAQRLRCLVGNPFATNDRSPTWRNETTLGLFRGIMQDEAYDRMPILADALEEAGCDDFHLLNHCRHAESHSGCCWVLKWLNND